MLLANLAKSPSIERLITLKRPKVPDLSPFPLAITQLTELFNRGANGGYNKDSTYDYLAYLFADLAKVHHPTSYPTPMLPLTRPQFPTFATYLTTPPSHSPLDPLTTFLPHTTHTSPIRRLGTASLLKNIAFLQSDILYLLQPAHSVLPPLLLPLCSSNQEGVNEEEMEALPEECQFLTEDHVQEKDVEVLKIHLETLYLLSTRGGMEGRRLVKAGGTYPVIRELHLQVEDEGVRRDCERLVDVLMGDEAEGGSHERAGKSGAGGRVYKEVGGGDVGRMVTQADIEEEVEEEDEDNEIVPIF